MKTDPNEPIGGLHRRLGTAEVSSGGLTKREYMALEFAKSRLNNLEMFKRHGAQYDSVADDGVRWADALIARLNNEQPSQMVPVPETSN